MKKYLQLSILFLMMNTPVFAASSNLQGTYHCKSPEVGTDKIYTGTMTLKKTGDTYTTNSKFNDGSSYKGTGIYDEKKHLLATAAINLADANEIGVGLNTIEKDGSMTVKWTYLNRTDVATAHCLKEEAGKV